MSKGISGANKWRTRCIAENLVIGPFGERLLSIINADPEYIKATTKLDQDEISEDEFKAAVIKCIRDGRGRLIETLLMIME